MYVAAIEDIAHGEGMAETVWVDIIDAGIVADLYRPNAPSAVIVRNELQNTP